MSDLNAYNTSQVERQEQRFLEPDRLNETENINEIIKKQHNKL
jgi:hypothetical protein